MSSLLQESKSTTIETAFNDWYKKFLDIEKDLTDQLKEAKRHKDEKVENARKEALELIKNYEIEQRENLEAAKAKISSTVFKGDEIEKRNKKDLDDIESQVKANKGKVIEFLIENVLHVDLELPNSIKKKSAKVQK